MTATMRSEWIKLRTVSVNVVLTIVAVLLPVAILLLITLLTPDIETFTGRNLVEAAVGASVVSVFLLGAASTISITSEFNHQTIRPTYAATPSRYRVMLAKLGVNFAGVFCVTAGALAVSIGIGWAIASARGAELTLEREPAWAVLASMLALAVAVAAFGFAIGMLIRNSPASVVVVLLWPLLIEGLVQLALTAAGWDSADKWMPYQAAISTLEFEQFGDRLGRPLGLVYFAAFNAVLLIAGAWINDRRDA